MLTRERALYWLERWDRQQEHYMPDREERFAVIADVVEELVARPDPLIVDLGIGPGSLAVRLLDRIPAATVVGVDADPLLRGLADLAHGSPTGCARWPPTCGRTGGSTRLASTGHRTPSSAPPHCTGWTANRCGS